MTSIAYGPLPSIHAKFEVCIFNRFRDIRGRCRKRRCGSAGAEREAGGRGAGRERGAWLTEIDWRVGRLFCLSCSAHMLCPVQKQLAGLRIRRVSSLQRISAKIFKTRHLPRSFKTQVGFVLDFYPVIAGTGRAVDAKVTDELQTNSVVFRSLPVTISSTVHKHSVWKLHYCRTVEQSRCVYTSDALQTSY